MNEAVAVAATRYVQSMPLTRNIVLSRKQLIYKEKWIISVYLINNANAVGPRLLRLIPKARLKPPFDGKTLTD